VIHANLNGRKRALRLTGTVLSPEFIYTIGPGAMMPDNAIFGILWMPRRAVAAAYDMEGAFNSVTLTLDPGATEAAVIDGLDTLLAPYGGLGAQGRDTQVSHSFVDAEITQLRTTAMILPPIFFAITIFLVGMVISRIVTLERSEIGLLKAIGYSDAEVCLHFLLLAGLIAVGGTLLGWAGGTWLSRALAQLYARFFDFPYLIYRVSYQAYAISGVLAVLSAAAGAARSALRAARLPPAVAMAPPAPPRFKRTLLDRGLAAMHLSQPAMMILRSMIRWPLRSALTSLGLSLAVAVLVASTFFSDALDEIVDTAFHQANRQNAMLLFEPDVPETALAEVARLPGVLRAEGQQFHAAVLRNGHLEKDTPIEARRPGTDLSRILDGSGRVVDPPPEGLLLSRRLADQLNVRPGQVIEVEFLGRHHETHRLRVAGVVTQYFGLGAYMDLGALNRLLRQAPRISTANLLLDESRLPELHAALKQTPRLGGLVMVDRMRRSFRDTIRENVTIMTTVYIGIAVLITVGVAYNAARIQLSERARELASLRILGFTCGEVSFVLIGETMLLALLAQPVGWGLGAVIAAALAHGSASDLYAIPLVLTPAAFARASLVVLAAALASALVLLGAGALLVGGLAVIALRADPVPVDLAKVTAGPMQVTVDVEGETRIREVYEIAAPITGTAQRAPVRVGDPVVAGKTVVAEVRPAAPGLLDTRTRIQAEAAVREAEAGLQLARSKMRQAEEELAHARSEYERAERLVERGVASLTRLEDAQERLAIKDAAMAAAVSGLEMAKSALDNARAALIQPDGENGNGRAECCVRLTAPVDGRVLSIDVFSERPVTAGTRLLSIGQPSDLEIVADVLTTDAVRLETGDRALVDRWGGDRPLEARLRRIEPAARTEVSALGIEEKRVDVVFDLVTPASERPSLRHGYSVFLRIVEWRADDVLRVPLGAVFRRGGDWAVFVAQSGTARLRRVDLGRRNDSVAEVQGGLMAGERVILHPHDGITDGIVVTKRPAP